ncbi:MAG: hypothetical protein JO069_09710 [Verrucomicrobia bacterium]|nr:hypothetical protein [Verrucomicrobiota bacterium]
MACGTVRHIVTKLRRSRGETCSSSVTRVDDVEPEGLERLRRELVAWQRRSGRSWTALAAKMGLPV